ASSATLSGLSTAISYAAPTGNTWHTSSASARRSSSTTGDQEICASSLLLSSSRSRAIPSSVPPGCFDMSDTPRGFSSYAPPGGVVRAWADESDRTWIDAPLGTLPDWTLVQLGDPAEVEPLKGPLCRIVP